MDVETNGILLELRDLRVSISASLHETDSDSGFVSVSLCLCLSSFVGLFLCESLATMLFLFSEGRDFCNSKKQN